MAAPSSTPTNNLDPKADPFSQQISIALGDGSTLTITPNDVDQYVNYGVRICINYASQIGASFVLLTLLLLLTRAERRASAIFGLNMTSLLLNGIRNILQCIYFSGPFYGFYAQFSGDFSRVPSSQYGASIAGIVMTFLLLCCIEASLVLQVRAVCVTLSRTRRMGVLVLTGLVALIAVAFRFALMVTNAQAVVSLTTYDNYQWLAATNNYVTMASICFFSLVFVTKLGLALQQRRKLGLRQFGPMQVIFIMGCQTLIVPAIFSILESFTDVPELGSQTITIVAIFLPLSSMWASAAMGQSSMLASQQNAGSVGHAGIRSAGLGPRSGRQGQHGSAMSNTTSTIRSSLSEDGDVEKRAFFGTFKTKLTRHSANQALPHLVPDKELTKALPLDLNHSSTVGQASTSPLTPTRRQVVSDLEHGEVRVDTTIAVTNEQRST